MSPVSNQPFDHKFLSPNNIVRKQIADWCAENGVAVPAAPKRAAKQSAGGGGGAALQSLLHKPLITCPVHSKEQLRVFCKDCRRGICFICACETGLCKAHTTKVFDLLLDELDKDKQEWSRAQVACDAGTEQLCAAIQADGAAKKTAIDAQVTALQNEVRSACAARSAAFSVVVKKRQEREALVEGAVVSADVAVKGSAAAAVVIAALDRAKGAVPPAPAAEYRSTSLPAAVVGHLVIAPAVIDPENRNDGLGRRRA